MTNLQFEPTTFCNAKCLMCPRYEMTRPMGQMSDELFYKIIKEGKEFGIKTYAPFLNGEPFVFKKIYDWLDYMEKEGCKFALYSNCELIDVDRLVKYKNIRKFNCSVNASTKETYDKIMRGPDYDRVIKNVNSLIKQAKFTIEVSMVVTQDNIHEVELFRKIWGKNANFAKDANWAGAIKSTVKKLRQRTPCAHLFHSITILWDGRACLCCMDFDGQVILGDLNKDSLETINSRYEKLRERHKKMDFNMPLCKNCNKNQ